MYTIAKRETKNRWVKGILNIYIHDKLYMVKVIVDQTIYNINPIQIRWKQGENPKKCYSINDGTITKFIPHETTLDNKLIRFKNNDVVRGLIKGNEFIIC